MKKICFILACVFSSVIFGENISDVFQTLTEQMLINHPRLQGTEARMRQRYYSIRESSGALFYPEVDLYASRSTTRTTYDRWERDDSKRTVEDLGVRLNYNLFRGFGDWHRRELSLRQYDAAKENWIYTAQGFLLNLIERYGAYLRAYENFQVAEETLRENESFLEFYTELQRLEMTVKSEYYMAKARFHEAEADYIRAQNNLETTYNNLVRLLNTEVKENLLQAKVEAPEETGYIFNLMNRPEYRLENYSLEMIHSERKTVQANFYPRLDFSTTYGQTDEYEIGESRAWRAQLQLSFNLFRGFQDINRLSQIDEELILVEQERIDLRRELENNFKNAVKKAESARQDYHASSEYLKAMEFAYEAASEELRLQIISYPEFMTVQTSWVRARENYNNAMLNVIFSDFELQVLSGTWYNYLHQFITARMK